ncbi:hypothetical protein [Flavobacterium aquicola]|uniref:Uncharacterized protein n=1 Tax=Flavobacterium aquicola TaxID=1682742 RepID=A0A3E0EAV2_9FLAO|nr:hypothetical protein [Flavobacterium aquicola]REG94146.1 hypothetical protein C8P67_113122 [Flavobacterium aquicola]
MTNTELIEFYENVEKVTPFTITRTVYDLTNDLDINLLRFLRRDFFHYHLLKIKAEVYRHSDVENKDIEYVFNTILNDDYHMYDMEHTIDFFCEYINVSFTDVLIDKTNAFFPVLNVLIDIAYSKLEKNQVGDKKLPLEVYDELIEDYNIPIVKRIIYLEKLGVIDFLKKQTPFNTSINSMANILGHIIDAKPSSIQPLLNPLLGNDLDNKNNPLNSAKNVMAVENYLLKIGYSLKKT